MPDRPCVDMCVDKGDRDAHADRYIQMCMNLDQHVYERIAMVGARARLIVHVAS